jgi:hypothetical protein
MNDNDYRAALDNVMEWAGRATYRLIESNNAARARDLILFAFMLARLIDGMETATNPEDHYYAKARIGFHLLDYLGVVNEIDIHLSNLGIAIEVDGDDYYPGITLEYIASESA